MGIVVCGVVLLQAGATDRGGEVPQESLVPSGGAPTAPLVSDVDNARARTTHAGNEANSGHAEESRGGSLPEDGRTASTRAVDLARADRMVAFANDASLALASGKYAQTDVLAAYTKFYLAEWQLARCPAVDARADAALTQRLIPPAGLFSPDESQKLAIQAQRMDKAIADMRDGYHALEAYVKDTSLRDNGVRGRQLGGRILQAHAAYREARNSWLHMVEAESGQAEELLLRGHPLYRQIRAAGRIFAVHDKLQQLLALPQPEGSAFAELGRELDALIQEADRPPFKAAPAVERWYRQFLKAAHAYRQGMAQGMAEGFHNDVREALNRAVLDGRTAYNAFVRSANDGRRPQP